MAFLLPNSLFIHIPKTGGQWVASALERAGVPLQQIGPVHASPDEIRDAVKGRSIVFAAVRHPLSWYPSMWAHRMDERWEPIDDLEWFTPTWVEFWAEFTASCRAETFSDFVRKCVSNYPEGFVSALYDAYTRGCTRIARYEHLAEDLLEILAEAHESFDVNRLMKTAPRNVRGSSPRWRKRHGYTPELEALVLGAEERVIRRFYGDGSQLAVGASHREPPEPPG